MNILFLTIGQMENIEDHTLYCDLLRRFRDHGHAVYTVSPNERRSGLPTTYDFEHGVHMLHIRTGNITASGNLIEKGLATVSVEPLFIRGIRRYLSGVKFDLVLYSTPPITFCRAVEYVKRRDRAKTYLLLKDIFPQNAVDLGMMGTTGARGVPYRYFRRKEKTLYAVSDRIGCMSPANVDYVLRHNPEIAPGTVEVCPNSVEALDLRVDEAARGAVRERFGIPRDRTVFVYGGNLGKPQGIDFLIRCLEAERDDRDAFFLIVGDGTEYQKLSDYAGAARQENFKLLNWLPKADFDALAASCDVGLLFLDHRFTIPNFPSRLLSYLQAGLPVLAATDPNTDVGKVIEDGGFGWWCESDDPAKFSALVRRIARADLSGMGERGFSYLREHYDVETSYRTIINSFEGNRS